MPNMPWFRFYSETLNDRKIRRICASTKQPKALIIGVWATILALANDSPERGKLMISDGIWIKISELEEETGVEAKQLVDIVYEFQQLNMMHRDESASNTEWGLVVSNWDGRQFKSDHSTPRVAKHREQKRQEEDSGNVTPALQEQPDGVIDTDTDTESEADTDTEQSKDTLGASAPPESVPQADGDYQTIRLAYMSQFPDKPKPRASNKTLTGKSRTRMKSVHFQDNWWKAMDRASRSSYLHREGWFNLGWFLKNDDNYDKCLNGNYDQTARASPRGSPPDPMAEYHALVKKKGWDKEEP